MRTPLTYVKYSAFLGLFLIFLVAAVAFFFTTSPGEDILRKTLEHQLEKSLNLSVSISSLETNIFSRIRVSGITAELREEDSTVPFVSVDDLRIDYRPSTLLTTRFRIDSVAIDGLAMTIARDSTGLKLPRSTGQPEDSRERAPVSFTFAFSQLEVTDSSIIYDDETVPLHLSSAQVTIAVREKGNGEYTFGINAASWQARYLDTRLPVDNFTLNGTFSPETVTIEQLEIVLPDIHCTLNTIIDLSESSPRFNGNAQISGNVAAFAPFLAKRVPAGYFPDSGIVEADIGFSGNSDNPEVSFSVDTRTLTAANIPSIDFLCRGGMRNRIVTVDDLRLAMFGGTLTGRGDITLDSLLTHHLALSFAGIDISRVWETAYKTPSTYRGTVKGTLDTGGPLGNLLSCNAEAGVTLENFRFGSQTVPAFTSKIAFRNNRFTFDLTQPQTTIQANLAFSRETVEGNFGFHTSNPGVLAGFTRVFGLNGILDVNGNISGDIRNPAITAEFSGDNIRYHGFPLDTARGRFGFFDGSVSIDECVFSGTLATVDSLSPSYRIPGLSGGLSYAGVLSGSMDDLDGRIDLHLEHPAYRDYRFEQADGTISITSDAIGIERMVFSTDSLAIILDGSYSYPTKQASLEFTFSPLSPETDIRGHMHIDGTFTDEGNVSLEAHGTDLNIGRLARIHSNPPDIRGLLAFDLRFDGSRREPSGELTIGISSPGYQQAAFDSLAGRMRIEPDRLTLEGLDITVYGQNASAYGDIELVEDSQGNPTITQTSGIKGSARGRNATIEIMKLLVPSGMSITGGSTFALDTGGTLAKPALTGTLDIIDAELAGISGTPPIEHLMVTTSFRDSIFVVEEATGIVNTLPFLVRGYVAIGGNRESFMTQMTVQVSGNEVFEGAGTLTGQDIDYQAKITDFDVGLLGVFISRVRNLSGRAHAFLSVTGPVRSPALDGTLRLSGIAFQPPFPDLPVTSGTASARFDQNTVYLDSLSFSLGDGVISSHGIAAHTGTSLTDLDLTTTVSNLRYTHDKDYRVAIDTSGLRIRKQGTFYDIEGDITLGESVLSRNFDPLALLPFMQRVERPTPDSSTFFNQIRVNVAIHSTKQLWLDNNLAHLRIDSNLALLGTLARPSISGRLSAEEGYVIYLDKKFKVNRGIMDFVDPNRINPVVDFSSSLTMNRYQTLSRIPYDITLGVTGPLDQTVFSLTSNPPLDRPDILALLTLGVTRSELAGGNNGNGEASLSEVLKERAALLSSQRVSGYVSQQVGTLLGLEDISIEGNLFNIGKSSGPQLVASERITDRMGITYTTTVGYINEQHIRLDYRLNDYLSLEGETDQRGRSGIDMKYKLRFR